MNCGRILYTADNGTYVLRLRGDVRASWCASLDAFLERMAADTGLRRVVVDLSGTTNVDSTTLGLLARIAIRARGRLETPPVLLSPNADVRRLLDSMCLDKVFTIEQAGACGDEGNEIPAVDHSESDLCRQVAEAHRVLMDIDERNRAVFHDVVATIESQQAGR